MKSVLKSSLLVLIAPCFMIACSSSNSGDGQPTVNQFGVPDTLGFQAPAAGAGLSRAEVSKLRSSLGVRPQMILPPGELVFPSGSTSAAELAQKENELKNKDANAYNLLMDLRQTCKRPHPTVKFGATFPTDSPATVDSIEAGDQVNFSAAASILGANCVTDLSGSYGGEAKANQVDHSSKSIAAEGGMNTGLKAVMKDARYAKLLGARGIIVNSDLKGLAMVRQLGETTNTGKGLITFNLNGSFLSLDADIPYSMTFKALIKGNEDKSTSTEMVITALIQAPGVTADVVVHSLTTKSASGLESSTGEIYVNGKQLQEQELKDLLGDTSETIIGHSATVNGLLLK